MQTDTNPKPNSGEITGMLLIFRMLREFMYSHHYCTFSYAVLTCADAKIDVIFEKQNESITESFVKDSQFLKNCESFDGINCIITGFRRIDFEDVLSITTLHFVSLAGEKPIKK